MQQGGCGARSVPAIVPKFGAISWPLNAVKLAHVPAGHWWTLRHAVIRGTPLQPFRDAWCFVYQQGQGSSGGTARMLMTASCLCVKLRFPNPLNLSPVMPGAAFAP